MKNRLSILGLFGGVILGLVTLAWLLRPATDAPAPSAFPAKESLPVTGEASPPPASTENIQPPDPSSLIPDPSAPAPLFPPGPSQGLNDPRWKKWHEMERKDRSFQWKTPIRFYGKVVDEEGNPVKGAKIRMGWNGMLGSQERFLTSDAQDLFSITGISGKVITAKPSHPDYHFSLIDNQWAFDYAAFDEPHYHVPDPKNPVVFKMARKGAAEKMAEINEWLPIDLEEPARRKLPHGQYLVIKLIENVKKDFDHDPANHRWKAEVSIEGGELQPCAEQFPRKAPESGYQTTLVLDKESPKPLGWIDQNQGGLFYVKIHDGGYGLLKLRTKAGMKSIGVHYLYNSKPSRNLEVNRSLVTSRWDWITPTSAPAAAGSPTPGK